jgi:hypothetical protein
MAEKLLMRRQLAEFLTQAGFPLSYSTLEKYCSPAINTGPPIDGYWGRCPMYRPDLALAWAQARLRPAPSSANTSAA